MAVESGALYSYHTYTQIAHPETSAAGHGCELELFNQRRRKRILSSSPPRPGGKPAALEVSAGLGRRLPGPCEPSRRHVWPEGFRGTMMRAWASKVLCW